MHQFEALVPASSFWTLTSCAIFLKYRWARTSSKENSVMPLSSSSLQYMLCSWTFPDSASCCCWWCSCSLFRGVSSLQGLRDDRTMLTAGLILHGVLTERRWQIKEILLRLLLTSNRETSWKEVILLCHLSVLLVSFRHMLLFIVTILSQVHSDTHIVGGWSDSSTNGWNVGLGGGGAMTARPNTDFWGIYDKYKLNSYDWVTFHMFISLNTTPPFSPIPWHHTTFRASAHSPLP